jgi:hypothetical protein
VSDLLTADEAAKLLRIKVNDDAEIVEKIDDAKIVADDLASVIVSEISMNSSAAVLPRHPPSRRPSR